MIPTRSTIVLTGASGSLASDIMPGLLARGYELRCIDRVPPSSTESSEKVTWHQVDLGDGPAISEVLKGADAVIHLAGIPLEDDWVTLSRNNVDATQNLLQAALHVGVSRVVLASSIHAAGLYPLPVDPRDLGGEKEKLSEHLRVPASVSPRPNTLYGVSKAAVEALGQFFADKHDLEIVCLRIASRFTAPTDERMLSTWLSPADAERLFVASVEANLPSPFVCVWGVSDNQRSYLSQAEGRGIGFVPEDNAEKYARQILSEVPTKRDSWDFTLGGIFSSPHPPRMGENLGNRVIDENQGGEAW